MTGQTAARLGELLAKATSLPWRLGRGHNRLSVSALSGKKMQIATSSWHSCSEHYPTQQSTLDNFALIVAAVNALPALLSERAAMQAEIARLRKGLRACAIQFRYYENSHKSKGTADGDKKAATNADFAEMAERLLAPQPKDNDNG